MAQSPKRITRKDLRQPDRFVTYTGRLLEFFRQHRRSSLIALGVMLAGLLLVGAWDQYRSRQLRLAANAYSQGLSLFHENKYREAIELFSDLSRWAPSIYKALSLLYLGNSHLALGEPQKAAAHLQRLTQTRLEHDYLKQLAFISLAYAHERSGNFPSAAKSFVAAETIPGPFTEESVLGRARTSLQAGDTQAALGAYRNYLKTFAGTEKSGEIALRIQELEAKVGKPEASGGSK